MKKAILALGVLIACGSFSAVQALPWESTRTTIQDLDNVCWGDRLLHEVTTDFQGKIYRGSIDFGRNYKIGGCNVGDRFVGSFDVLGAQKSRCKGEVTVTFLVGRQAQIEWNITNSKVQEKCPVQHNFWETTVQELNPDNPLGLAFTNATVAQIPAKVRTAPNGQTICTLSLNQTVRITSQPYNGWYRTDVCGAIGYIYDKDLQFSPAIAP